MDHAFSKQWHGVGPISSTHPASPIPCLHRWLPDRFCLNYQPAIHTSCTTKISLCGWPASLLHLSSLEADGLRRQAHSETCSGHESRLETYYAVGPNSFSLAAMLNSDHVDVAGLLSLDEESRQVLTDNTAHDGAPVLDEFLQACDAERFGTWSFCTLVRGIEWDPALFTREMDECGPKLGSTFENASILTYACGNRATPAPHGHVPVEGYLKMKGTNTVMCSTLKRHFQHQDLQNPLQPRQS